MKSKLIKQKEVHKALVAAFKEFVVTTLKEVDFYPNFMSDGAYGKENGDHRFEFLCLFEEDILDYLDFSVRREESQIVIHYNRARLSREIKDLNFFEGKTGLRLDVQPYAKTLKEIERYAPIPFLHWPLRYSVKWNGNSNTLQNAVMKPIEKIVGDMKYIEIVRAEWDAKYKPELFDLDGLGSSMTITKQ